MSTNRKDIIVAEQSSLSTPYINASLASAVTVILPAGTNILEVQADNDHVYLRYGVNGVVTTCTAANSQERIQAGSTRHYSIDQNDLVISIIGASAASGVHVYFKTA